MRHGAVDFCVTLKNVSANGDRYQIKTCKPFVLNHTSSSLKEILLEESLYHIGCSHSSNAFLFSYLLEVDLSLAGQRSLAGRGGVGRRQPLRGGGRRQRGLQVDRLVEKLVADQHDQGEET